ncbi:MAG: DUF4132 domain-containing protein [Capsulimonadales bacterium]|nr:DUF4132 domain-containing protein [Capsulimonadales bacterium]
MTTTDPTEMNPPITEPRTVLDTDLEIPDFGFAPEGFRRESLEGYEAFAAITGTGDVRVLWTTPGGETSTTPPVVDPSVPAADRIRAFADEMRAATEAISEQEIRFDGFFLPERNWTLGVWRARYARHPIYGHLAKRLIWHFAHAERKLSGIWDETRNGFVDVSGHLLNDLTDDTLMRLWHPIGYSTGEIETWRAFLLQRRITQPFKQAHREVYLPPDPDPAGEDALASDRFARFTVRRDVVERIAASRDWERTPDLLTKALPELNLRLEISLLPTTTPDLLTTGNLRFFPSDSLPSEDPLPLSAVPPLVFSEAMREAERFASGDGSVAPMVPGEKALRSDAEPVSGPLLPSAETRRDVLRSLLPLLALSDRTTVEEDELVLRLEDETVRLHLGTGAIRPTSFLTDLSGIEPPYVPFEGDDLLTEALRLVVHVMGDPPSNPDAGS